MDPNARDFYLEAQVMTATPQKLRLMLIENAIRLARATLRHWQEEEDERASESLIRCRSVISELLSSITPDKTQLTRKVAGVYLYLFKTLTEAQLRRDPDRVNDFIEILEVERETWRLVCEKLPNRPIPSAGDQREITAADTSAAPAGKVSAKRASPSSPPDFDLDPCSGGIVLDA